MSEPKIRTGTPEDFLRMVVHFDLVLGEAPNAAIRRAHDMFSWPVTAHNTLHF